MWKSETKRQPVSKLLELRGCYYIVIIKKIDKIFQVIFELGEPYNQMDFASFMSCSKVKINII